MHIDITKDRTFPQRIMYFIFTLIYGFILYKLVVNFAKSWFHESISTTNQIFDWGLSEILLVIFPVIVYWLMVMTVISYTAIFRKLRYFSDPQSLLRFAVVLFMYGIVVGSLMGFVYTVFLAPFTGYFPVIAMPLTMTAVSVFMTFFFLMAAFFSLPPTKSDF